MNTKFAQSTIVFLLLTIVVNAQTPIVITGTKFTYPLISKWIAEYTKENPQVQILLVNKNSDAKKVDISIIANQPTKTEVSDNQQVFSVNKYALLPVASNTNSYIKRLRGHKLDKKEIDKLYFDESIFAEKSEKTKSPVNVYARESQASSSIAFADYFGREPSEIRGKKIAGDDIFLLSSVKKDSIGITFNNLSYLYDISTRKLKDGINILPLDITKETASYLNNVDDAIYILEKVKVETIPVEKINFVLDKVVENTEVLKFISWVINNGQQFNHQYGFLDLDKTLQKSESSKLSESILTAAK
jgi:phosphate transport system substrate-binding protein